MTGREYKDVPWLREKVSCQCASCELIYVLSDGEWLCYCLGLYPHRCPKCGALKYNQRVVGLHEYMQDKRVGAE